MKTEFHARFRDDPEAREAEAILRACVHCGFCNATCPTYQELGDERDGPRGRIYLMKQLFEEGGATEKTVTHLDRCLTCRACETTCPSGVQYGRLVDIGRHVVEKEVKRPLSARVLRWCLLKVLPYPKRFTALLRMGQLVRPLLPRVLQRKIPARQGRSHWPESRHSRVMVALAGCAQPGATPNTNLAAARVLDKLGITLVEVPNSGCCGAASYHLSEHDAGLNFARRNIDAWWPAVEQGAEAIVITASGCGTMVKDYGHLLAGDAEYAEKARKVSELSKDLSEVIVGEDLTILNVDGAGQKIAVHCPCSLQHGQQLPDTVDDILRDTGFALTATKDKHLCCGSAGTYSILQPVLSQQLLDNKLEALAAGKPDRIVTANVGCQLHLSTKSTQPVKHWIEVIDELIV